MNSSVLRDVATMSIACTLMVWLPILALNSGQRAECRHTPPISTPDYGVAAAGVPSLPTISSHIDEDPWLSFRADSGDVIRPSTNERLVLSEGNPVLEIWSDEAVIGPSGQDFVAGPPDSGTALVYGWATTDGIAVVHSRCAACGVPGLCAAGSHLDCRPTFDGGPPCFECGHDLGSTRHMQTGCWKCD